MENESEQFRLTLNDQQRERFQHWFNHMDQNRERINNRLQQMEQEMNSGDFDRIRQRNWIRDIEKSMNNWRDQYRRIGSVDKEG
jgi:DNA-binding PadR family transcriptional regulator